MNILIVTEYFPESDQCEVRGGAEARAFYMARELAQHHRVAVVCSRETDQAREVQIAGMHVYRCGSERAYDAKAGSFGARLSFFRAAVRQVRALARDVDVIDGYNFLTYLVVLAATRQAKNS